MGEADEARDRTAYGTGVLEVGIGATTGVVDLGGAKTGVVDLGGAAVGVLDLGGVSDGGDATAGKGLFLFAGDRRSLSASGTLAEVGILATGEGDAGVDALESDRTCVGTAGVDAPGDRPEGRSGEGLAG